MQKSKNLIIIVALIPLLILFSYIFKIGHTLDMKLLDLHFVLRGDHPLSDDVFIVAMGDESISPTALGRWPWRRAYMASFTNMMIPYGPERLVFDILFTEPSEDFPSDDRLLAEQAGLSWGDTPSGDSRERAGKNKCLSRKEIIESRRSGGLFRHKGKAVPAETFDDRAVRGIVEKFPYALRHCGADIPDRFQRFGIGFHESVECAEMIGQDSGGARSHVTYAKAEDQVTEVA